MMGPPTIRRLDELVANQIAAGEVVERPASVVRELIENAIDAGARRITVRARAGGCKLIEVVDDGCGMREADLALALERHATSKIRDSKDLVKVASLGFRGEALPSIAAVSEYELASRPAGETEGRAVAGAGTDRGAPTPVGISPGTRVRIRNLFWNVPARLKFLKSARAEGAAIGDLVLRCALGHPRIAFRCELDERIHCDFPAEQDLIARIRQHWGRDAIARLLPIAAATDSMQIEGFVGHPEQARPSARRQFVFLGGRALQDKVLVAALREGFKGFLEPRMHPVAWLHLDVDPGLVDVNVHPAKAEVRFRRQGEVFALVRDAVAAAVEEHAGGFRLLAGTPEVAGGVRHSVVRPAREPAIQERFLPHAARTDAAEAPPSTAAERVGESRGPSYAASPPPPETRAPAAGPAPASPSTTDTGYPPGVRRVLQLHDMYLLLETDDGIRLVDQHALHEKALFLCLDDGVTAFEDGGRQELLVPRVVECDAATVAAVEPHLPRLAAAGIEVEPFGPSSLAVRAHPARLARVRWEALFHELAELREGEDPLAALRERLAHSRACRSAIKAGHRLGEGELQELVRLLYDLEHMEHCPHGRPTTLDLSWDELERRFQR